MDETDNIGRTGPGEGYQELARVVRETARRHGLRHGYLEDGEPVLPGRRGQVYLDGSTWCWALTCEAPHNHFKGPTLKNRAKRDERLELLVEGDEEALFAIRSEEDLRDVALRLCQCRRIPQLSPEERERRAAQARRMLAARALENGTKTAPESPNTPEADSSVAVSAADGSSALWPSPAPDDEEAA